jgi:hypothetical protein
MTAAVDVVFLLDVDNTLLDNDRVQVDLRWPDVPNDTRCDTIKGSGASAK